MEDEASRADDVAQEEREPHGGYATGDKVEPGVHSKRDLGRLPAVLGRVGVRF